MELKEMRALPPVELRSEIEKTREKIWKMRFQAKGEPLENPGALRSLKKDIARLMTVLAAKEREARDAASAGAVGSSPSGSIR